ncbi:prepilin-type N-terminal cleavage/methylation domain-containing protein [Candidatus Saganbacteria bacterium]|nr:prepilin-type N-terminal cleavage/methylation domain-containing protein [Candidatus Saganbacteria bacterium]
MKNNKKGRACRQAGFTLIEILVVLGIIGLLIAFLVPNILGAQDKSKETAVKAVIHSVQLAVEAYNMENLTYPVGKNITVYSLCTNYLIGGNFISKVPTNPYTGQEYKDSDTAGKIIYNYNEIDNNYTLTGYKRNGFSKILELTNM